jgi:hypothetical protein
MMNYALSPGFRGSRMKINEVQVLYSIPSKTYVLEGIYLF